MIKFLPYMYLLIAIFCFENGFLSIQMQEYQHTILLLCLAFFNLMLYKIFRKEAKKPHLKLIRSAKQ
ncbi:hypothetical protein PB1_12409 [Bacillus methanolicus PB1]|uniref:Uncharacterized protein n=1 Tax=Bacillus methanolicus PB1 TaxID=997296 RepID=I3DVU1_BACMT|nr:hypothetical protein PB1_12409 [Bacillus methanolicus PB1]